MTEPQIWTMIASFTALMFGMMTVVSTLFVRVLRAELGSVRSDLGAEIGRVRSDLGAEISGLRSEIGSVRNELRSETGSLRSELRSEVGSLRNEMRAGFAAVDARFDAVHTRIDGLDRDVQALVKRTFGLDRE